MPSNRNANSKKKRRTATPLARQEQQQQQHRDSIMSIESVETTRTTSHVEDGFDQSTPHQDWMAPLAQMNVPTGVPLRDLAGTPSSSKKPKNDLRRGDDVHPCVFFDDLGNEDFSNFDTSDDDLFHELIVTCYRLRGHRNLRDGQSKK
mmetsp:Transcript_21809/g.49930  ORF Transcript_21809/g.49930 Transcript_21809/m.49930 type:complete len:148 (-) Transcript_21809:2-445(-)